MTIPDIANDKIVQSCSEKLNDYAFVMKQIYLLLCLLLNASLLWGQNMPPVRFKTQNCLFPQNAAARIANPAANADLALFGKIYLYVQFNRHLTSYELKAAQADGLQFLQYIPEQCYLMAIPADFNWKNWLKLPVYSFQTPQSNWKMAPELLERPLNAWADEQDQLHLNVQLYPGISPEQGATLLANANIRVLETGKLNAYFKILIHKNSLEDVAAMPFVAYLERIAPPSEPEDIRARGLQRANTLDSDMPNGLHFDGSAVKVLVRDDGKVGPHEDFRGRLTELSTSDSGDHGDWVSGALGGAGNIDPTAKGIATGASIYAAEYDATFQDDKLLRALDAGIRLTNTSYSDGCNLGYTIGSQTVDKQMETQPLLTHVFSAGNNGTANCNYGAGAAWGNITGGHKMAKNAIDVGNLSADGALNNSSSRGPASDGRLKPDICAMGTNMLMTQPFQTYSQATGTSFSAPATAGSLAQLTQAFQFLQNGVEPPSALLKAALLNTATDLGNPGPDFSTGYGLINSFQAYKTFEQNKFTQYVAEQGSQGLHTITVPPGTRQLRAMIAWTDPAAAANAAKTLVNDLDLQVLAPDGSIFLPWKLDPTPNPTALNTPAARGRDSLNNVEQVLIDNPLPGNYVIWIKGYAVPMPPQTYQVVWSLIDDKIQITYPAGGEGFAQGQSERIYWDALGNTGTFNLSYSLDEGNNWSNLASIAGDKRFFDWTIPANSVSGKTRLRIERNGQSFTTPNFSIAPVPSQITIEKVCPDSMRISWKKTSDSLQYDVYLLGKKYMEIVGHTQDNAYTFPVSNGGATQWVSVRCADSTGLSGRRAYAVQWKGNLKNCTQAYDAGLRKLVTPAVDAFIQCSGSDQTISVRILNEGANPIEGAFAHYQIDNQPIVDQLVPNIPVNDSITFTFTKPFYIGINGKLNLTVWLTYPPDQAAYNDTISRILPVISQSTALEFTQTFEGNPNIPAGWTVVNPDQQLTWELQRSGTIGAEGNITRAFKLPCYDYNTSGAEDYIYTIPLDLSALQNPTLLFDLSYAQYDANSSEQLRVELFENCQLNGTPIQLWKKEGSALATAAATTGSYVPTSAGNWRTEGVDLSPFKGQNVLLRFASVNNYGNNMYLDNIKLINFKPAAPIADFMASTDTICRLDTIVYQVVNQDPITQDFNWYFGTQSLPNTATGPGPHKVWYISGGTKNVRLIASSAFGKDTITKPIVVRNFPTASFTTQVNDLSVGFNNTSQFANSFLWDFGDGSTSTEKSPVHTYASPGNYTVKLSASNACKTVEKTQNVLTILDAHEAQFLNEIQILPNPNDGRFTLLINVEDADPAAMMQVFDALGRVIATQIRPLKRGENRIGFDEYRIPKGTYQLQVSLKGQTRYLPLLVN